MKWRKLLLGIFGIYFLAGSMIRKLTVKKSAKI